jgi:hypothetical protein
MGKPEVARFKNVTEPFRDQREQMGRLAPSEIEAT